MRIELKSNPALLYGHEISKLSIGIKIGAAHHLKVSLNSAELNQFGGPLREYLIELVRVEIDDAETSNLGHLYVLAELELDGWFQGRHNSVTRFFDHFRQTQSMAGYGRALINRLASLL